MKPTLSFLCLINLQPQKNYNIGDIVTFQNHRNFFLTRYCHRIKYINTNENLFTAKGDNREKSDRYEIDISIENIEGKVINFKKII